MELTRNLKKYRSGEDVRWVKENLFKLGYYSSKIKKITNSRYGNDTYAAVKAFQKAHNLTEDGIYGQKSHKKMLTLLGGEVADTKYLTGNAFPRIAETTRAKINAALNDVSEIRRKVVLEALKYATDASIAHKFKHPSSLYIRGGNLYDKNKKLNIIKMSYLTGAYKKKYASYCTHGRLEMMQSAVAANSKITGADCSGGLVGIFRYFDLVGDDFDDTANGLLGGHSKAIKKENLTAGDLIGRSGHICLYVGGGFMVEWAGGEYGCQISKVSDRRCWSFTRKSLRKLDACTKYRDPKFYD